MVIVVPPLTPHRWLRTLNEYGVCLLTDYGTKKGSVKEVRQVLFLVVVNVEFLFLSFFFQLTLRTLYAIQSSIYGEVSRVSLCKH